jgi:hypothetical protein
MKKQWIPVIANKFSLNTDLHSVCVLAYEGAHEVLCLVYFSFLSVTLSTNEHTCLCHLREHPPAISKYSFCARGTRSRAACSSIYLSLSLALRFASWRRFQLFKSLPPAFVSIIHAGTRFYSVLHRKNNAIKVQRNSDVCDTRSTEDWSHWALLL